MYPSILKLYVRKKSKSITATFLAKFLTFFLLIFQLELSDIF